MLAARRSPSRTGTFEGFVTTLGTRSVPLPHLMGAPRRGSRDVVVRDCYLSGTGSVLPARRGQGRSPTPEGRGAPGYSSGLGHIETLDILPAAKVSGSVVGGEVDPAFALAER